MKIDKADFAIITVLPEEYKAIHDRFTPEPSSDPSNHLTYGISHIKTKEGKNCVVAIARTGEQGNDISQRLAHWMITDLDPQMLLVVGIGGGIPDNDFTLGDVIISSRIHSFAINAIKGNEIACDVTGGIHPVVSNITASLYLYESQLVGWNTEESIGMKRPVLRLTEKRAKEFIDKDVDEVWRKKVEQALREHFDTTQLGARAPNYLTGSIASSNTLIRSVIVLAQLLQGARSIRAVEMEVAGVYQAAQHIRRQYPVMAIRGISDIIGFKRDDNWKRYACHTAAAFAHAFITAGIVEPRETVSQLDVSTLETKVSYRGIVGSPPPTDLRTIQQRERVVKEVYMQLLQPDLTAIVLTGISGVGKSTLAALIYRYAEAQRSAHRSPFFPETLWLTIDPAVTLADLAGNLFEALGKPLPDLSKLAPQNQAVALFNALNTTNNPYLVILDQFENLLNWETGHALTDRPGVGEWLDIINSQPCACRLLLTSSPRPVGTRQYPPTYLQEYPVMGLEVDEGIALLQNQGVQGTETELRIAVTKCNGHALSLTLLASLLRNHHMDLTTLFTNTDLWTGNIATNFLDQIYTQRLSKAQRELLLAFSVYREPVRIDAAQAIVTKPLKAQMAHALNTLLTQNLLEGLGEGRYQLHAIIADYAQRRLNEDSEQNSEESLRSAHARAAQFYLQRAAMTCPPQEQRRRVSDVHDLIEAIWQLCQAEQWQEAYDLMEKQAIFANLNRWGSNAVLLELYQPLQTVKWSSKSSETAHVYNNLAWAFMDLGQMEQAQKHFEKALQLWEKVGDKAGKGAVLNSLGSVYRDLGQKQQGQQCLEQALTISRELENREEESRALLNLAIIYSDFGQKEQARVFCEEALKIYKDLGDHWGEGWALNNLGAIYTDLGQKERARDYLEQSLQRRRGTGNRLGEDRTLNNLGLVNCMLEHNEQALKYSEEALKISREIGDYLGEGKAYNNLGFIYVALGEMERAREYHEQALYILRKIGDRGMEGRTLYNLGSVYKTLGQKEESFKSYREASAIFNEIGDSWREGETLHSLGKLYFDQARYDLALACFRQAKTILDELQNPRCTETQRQIEVLHETIGDEQFTTLVEQVESQSQHMVYQALREGIQ